ncbi:MAG: hypothetical protein JW803_01200 [Endomicrobiales bacterium]|nr:hypothetical protein [Endomicrobiales bacterium]
MRLKVLFFFVLSVLLFNGCASLKKADEWLLKPSAKPSDVTSKDYPIVIIDSKLEKKIVSQMPEQTEVIITGTAKWVPGPGGPADKFNHLGLIHFELLDSGGKLVANHETTFWSLGQYDQPSNIVPNEPFPFKVSALKSTELMKNVVSHRYLRYRVP